MRAKKYCLRANKYCLRVKPVILLRANIGDARCILYLHMATPIVLLLVLISGGGGVLFVIFSVNCSTLTSWGIRPISPGCISPLITSDDKPLSSSGREMIDCGIPTKWTTPDFRLLTQLYLPLLPGSWRGGVHPYSGFTS